MRAGDSMHQDDWGEASGKSPRESQVIKSGFLGSHWEKLQKLQKLQKL